MAIAAQAFQGINVSPDFSRRSPYHSEIVQITGTTGVAGDTATFTPKMGKPAIILGGAFTITTITGNQATIKAEVAIGNDVVFVEMLVQP